MVEGEVPGRLLVIPTRACSLRVLCRSGLEEGLSDEFSFPAARGYGEDR